MGWTLDGGVLVAADRNERRVWRLLERTIALGEQVTVPAVVLTKVWRGAQNANLARALRGCELEPVDVELAMAAGVLCGRAGTDDPVDAIVIVSAARRGDDIVTTDAADLRELAAATGNRTRILDLHDL